MSSMDEHEYYGCFTRMTKHLDRRSALMCLALMCLGGAAATASEMPAGDVAGSVAGVPVQAGNGAPVQAEEIYARVDGIPITVRQYNALFGQIMKDRFYHAKVPEGQGEVVRKEVTDRLVERILLLQDAQRRGLTPDERLIEQGLAAADAKYTGTPMWKERERLLAELKEILAMNSLLDQLGKMVRDVPPPTDAEVRDYYDRHVDMFTVPEKLRLSVILLRVDPAAPLADWAKALEDAQAVYRQLQSGADFAELARQRSGDKSAKEGGDLGYLHRGMLPAALHSEIDKMQVGVPSEPIKGLEGFSLFRLEERVPARQQEFSRGETRARELLMRERQDQAWKDNIERLRSAAIIEILIQPGDGK